jgi:PKD repeat protein
MFKSPLIKFSGYLFFLVFLGYETCAFAQGFNPTSIQGLKLWINGDNVSLAAGSNVDTCYDLSGNNNHLFQSTPANQPVSVASGLSGHNTLSFSGSFCHLNFSEINDIRTVFWVLYEDSIASVQRRPLLGHGGFYDFYRGSNSAFWDVGFTNPNILNGTTRINFNSISGVSTSVPKNYSVVSLITTGNVKAENFALDRFVPNSCWAGGLAELIIYNTPLSPSEIAQVEGFLSDKYAPPVNLGADITVPYGFCDTTLSVGNYNQILWSNGQTTSSIQINKSGKYWVDVIDVFGRQTSDTILVSYPAVSYPSDTVICSGIPEVWNINLPSVDYTFLWSNSSTSTNVTISPGIPYFLSITDTNGCVFHSDTLVFNTNNFSSSPLLGADTIFCNPNSLSHLPFTEVVDSLLWSTGLSTDSIFVSLTGIYSLSAINTFGCLAVDTIAIQVESPPNFTLGNDTLLCYGQSYSLSPALSNCTYLWSNNSTGSSIGINQEGIYWLSATNSFGCTSSDTIVVTVDTTFKNSTLGPDISLCAGNFLALLNTNASLQLNYQWSDNSSNDSLLLNNTGSYWLNVSNFNGCFFTDSVNVTIIGVAPTTFFTGSSPCFGTVASFLDQTIPPSGTTITSYSWDFGDGNTSIAQNPQHLYADTGVFVVKLLTTTNVGCSGNYLGSVHVYPLPVSDFTSQGSSLCKNESVVFSDNSSGSGYPIFSWSWDFGDPASGSFNTSTIQNPNHLFTSDGSYTVTLTVQNDKGCSDLKQVPINIKPVPVANFNFSLECSADSVAFTDNSTLQPGLNITSANWDFAGQGIASSLSPNFLFNQGGTFPVTYVAGASNNCFDTITLNVQVNPSPIAGFSLSGVCVFDTIQFTDSTILSSGTVASWNWQLNGQNLSSSQNTSYIFNVADTVAVRFAVVSNLGCADTLYESIIIRPLPAANFSYSPAYGSPPLDVVFTNSSSGGSTYSWNFGDGFISNSVSPIHQYVDTGLFLVSMKATSAFGCEAVDTASVLVYLPRLDVAVAGASFTEDDGFLKITGLFRNAGTIPVTTMDLYAKLNDGSFVRETWSGFLPKGAILSYVFNSKLYLKDNENYVCLSVLDPNGMNDEVSSNNEFCDAYEPEGFIVYDIYPNPSSSFIRVPFYLPQRSDITFTLYDANGKIVWDPQTELKEKGFYNYEFTTENLGLGLYCLTVENKNKKIRIKFLRGN